MIGAKGTMADAIHHNVLIVDDEPEATRRILQVLAERGIRGSVVGDLGSAAEKVDGRDWDLVMADLTILGPRGREVLRKIKSDFPELPIVAIGKDGSAEAAVGAMQAGCDDYLVKPPSREKLRALVEAILPNHEVPLAAADQADVRCLCQIAGRSRPLLDAIELARKVAPSSIPILISGESGTGKELLSYLVHRSSSRERGPYVRVNCAALSESLLESELFGHERGAFTGAYAQRKGKFERAHGGTLLLDEISETGPRLQAELLRVLEQQDFERVGGSEPIRVNVRLVTTTNRDLSEEVRKGKFRRDLYYRIKGVQLMMPPLRQRPEDIPVLVWHFVNLYAREVRRRITELDPDMLEQFARHPWPGNVRQLRNVVRAALILGSGPTLSLEGAARALADVGPVESSPAPSLSLQELERRAIFEALRRTKSHQAKAARLLGITDRTLREKLRRYRSEGHRQAAGEVAWAREPA